MKKFKRKWKGSLKRAVAIALAVLMVGNTMDMSAFAASAADETQSGICGHHIQHTDECGYVEAVTGQSCTHVCDEICGGVQAATGSAITICNHVHDESCGYTEAAEGTACAFSCEECASEEATCTCETDDSAIHATNCPAYAAPESPACSCTEKCTKDNINIWCDVCGVQGAEACTAEGEAVMYADVEAKWGDAANNLTNSGTFDEAIKANSTYIQLQSDVSASYLTIKGTTTLDLNNHTITGNGSQRIFGVEGGNLTLTDTSGTQGGQITNAGGDAAVVVYSSGQFTMEAGSITGNMMGGVRVYKATFTMNGGSITENTKTGDGGGVLNQNSLFIMNGGSITGNSASSYGGGIHSSGDDWDGDATFELSGTVDISGNTATAKGDDIYLSSSNVTIGESLNLLSSVHVYKYVTDTENTFATAADGVTLDGTHKGYFISDNPDYPAVSLDSDSNALCLNSCDHANVSDNTCSACNSKMVATLEIDGTTTYHHSLKTAFNAAVNTTSDTPGIITLLDNVNGADYITITSGAVTLNLNNKTLEASFLMQGSEASLTPKNGTINSNNTGLIAGIYVQSGSVTLDNVIIEGNTDCDIYIAGDDPIIIQSIPDGEVYTVNAGDGYAGKVFAEPAAGVEALSKENWASLQPGGLITENDDGSLAFAACDHSGSKHTTYKDRWVGLHSFTCTVCNGTAYEDHYGGNPTCSTAATCSFCQYSYTVDHQYTYSATENVITETCIYNCEHRETVTIEAPTGTFVYDGTAKEGATVIYSNSDNWQGERNLTPTYENNINAGKATASISVMDGEKEVKASATFTITAKDIAGATIGDFTEMTYTGQAQTPVATVTIDGLTATGSWSKVTNVGEKTTFTASGNFTGTVEADPSMAKATPDVTVSATDLTYNAEAQELVSAGSTTGGTLQYALGTGSTTAPGDDSWGTTIPTGTDAKTYYVWYKVVGGTNYADVAAQCVDVTISPKQVTAIWLGENFASEYPYTGTVINPVVTNLYNDDTGALIPSGQYTVVYSTSAPISVGEYYIGFKGVENGNYTFDSEMESDAFMYRIIKAKPVITWSDASYTKEYTGNVAAISATIEMNSTDTAGTITYSYTGTVNGQTVSGTGLPTDAGSYTVTAKYAGDDNHEAASADVSLTITPASIASASVTVDATGLTYDGTEKKLTNLTVTLNGNTLSTNDYEIIGYSNNTDAGTATITVRGKGNYTGEATGSFTIGQAEAQTLTGEFSVTNGLANTYNFDLSGYKPTGTNVYWGGNVTYTLDTVSITESGYYTDGAKIEESTLILPINGVESTATGSIGTITVKITSQNFAESTLTLTVNRTNHTHNWSYDGNGDTITATCTNADGKCLKTTQTITVNAPDADALTYSGTAKEATVTGSIEGVTTPAIVYTAAEGSSLTADKPVNAGTYTASISLMDGENEVKANVTFEIEKADASVSAVPTAKTGLTYTGNAQELIAAGTATGGEMQYSLDGTSYSTAIPTGTDAKEYTVYYKVVGDSNHNDTEAQTITVTISKGTAPAITEPTANSIFYGQTLSAVALSDTSWKWMDGTAVPDVTNSGYEAYVTVDDTNYDYTGVTGYDSTAHAVKRTIAVTVGQAVPVISVQASPVSAIAGKTIEVTVTVTNPYNSNVEVPTVTLTYRVGSGTEQNIEKDSFVIPAGTEDGTTITITATTAASDNYAAGKGTTTVTVTDCTHAGNKTLKYDTASHWYICGDCDAELDKAAHSGGTATCTTLATCATCNQSYGSIAAHSYSYGASGNVITETCSYNCGHNETATITAQAVAYTGNAQTSAAVTYSSGWTGGTLTPDYENNTNVGTATASITLGTATASVSFEIGKADASVSKAPTAIESLKYNGTAQALIMAGEATGGEMQYSLDGINYSTAIPTGTDAKEYTVYYKVVGDSNHNDTTVQTITVMVAKKIVTDTDVTVPTAGGITYGQPLSAATLSDTSWKWTDGTAIPAVGGSGYEAYVSVDDTNYDYSGVDGYDSTAHTVKRTIAVTVSQATPAIIVQAAPASAIAEKTIQVSATVKNPNNESLTDLATPTYTYKIGDSGTEQTFTGSFDIPVGTATGTTITITATTAATANYAAGTGAATVTVTDCTHTGNKTLKYDTASHWYHCEDCGAEVDKAGHSGGTATCKSPATCTDCGQTYGDLNSSNHTGGTEVRGKVDATATTAGYTGDTYCLGCNTKIKTGTTIPATGSGGGGTGGNTPPAVTPTPVPTATPRPTSTPASPSVTPTSPQVTPVPTMPVPTVTPVPGITKVPSSGEQITDGSGNPVQVIVQEPGMAMRLMLRSITEEESGTVTWESTNTDIIEVDENGNITMKNPGMAEIVVTIGEGSDAKKETVVIVVREETGYANAPEEAGKYVELGPTKTDTAAIRVLHLGEETDINFWGVKNWTREGYEYNWESSDESVLTTTELGEIKAVAPGVAVLTLELKNKETGKYLNVRPMVIIVPGSKDPQIWLGTSKDSTFDKLELGQDERIDLNFYGVKNWKREDYEYLWISSDREVVWVDNKGNLTPVRPGKAVVALVLVEKATGCRLNVIPVEVTVTEK